MVDDEGKDAVGITGLKMIVKEILIVFLRKEDYTAFKLVFPELC